jgi:ABC-type glycerol-3-phosphate transport system substrate-binding protein
VALASTPAGPSPAWRRARWAAARRSAFVRVVALAVALTVVVALAGCRGSGEGSAFDGLGGATIEVTGVWFGTEQQRFEEVLQRFEMRTGASVTYTSAGHGVPDLLAERAATGRLPDVAFLPQPGLLASFVQRGWLVPVDDLVGDAVDANWGPVWRRLSSVDGHLYGVWYKAADKSVVWYNVGVFEGAGLVPPEDLDGLLHTAQRFAALGTPAFSVGAADGWTLTDWFENLYLRLAGPERYDQLAEHRLQWTDDSVKQTLALLHQLLAPELIAGRTAGALATDFAGAVHATFAPPPAAAMTFEGDFVAGLLEGTPVRLGVDADVFPFPAPAGSSTPALVGGGDLAVLMRPSAAGEALIRFLASTEAAAIWAVHGGFLSPNRDVDLVLYPDDTTRAMARAVLDSGDAFRFDLSDLQPAGFGSSRTNGLRKELQDFLRDGDVDATAANLEAAASAAFGR